MEPLDYNSISNQVSSKPIGVRYGLILGLVSAALSIVFIMTNTIDFSGTKSNYLSSIISWAVSIFFFYKAIDTYKIEMNGYITLGKCISVSLWVGLVSGLISAVFMCHLFNHSFNFMFVYFKFIDPTFIDKTMDLMRANLEEKGMDASQVETAINMSSMFLSPASMAGFTLIGSLFMALILGLILGLILKKDPPSFT